MTDEERDALRIAVHDKIAGGAAEASKLLRDVRCPMDFGQALMLTMLANAAAAVIASAPKSVRAGLVQIHADAVANMMAEHVAKANGKAVR